MVKQTERKRARERDAADVVLKQLDQAHQTIRGLAQPYTAAVGPGGQGPDENDAEALRVGIADYIAILRGITGGAIDKQTPRL
jgi:hypothetical protein